MIQDDLFSADLPHGLLYRPDFVTAEEEAALLAEIGRLAFRRARFRQYIARRRVVRFGSEHVPSQVPDQETDFPRIDFPPFLCELRGRIAEWAGVPAERFEHGLITEYAVGTPIGWHRDAPHHETVAGLSLAGPCRMRFRPLGARDSRQVIGVALQPRSLYVMRDAIRWGWQHSIPAVTALRYSITLRTQRTS
jgi:alkylated DNA repair dioxygenase AlkB